MDLIAFRVRMYKGIIDSGWVDVNSLTVFVGKNESGKTSLLKALHKLNPYTSESQDTESEPYKMEMEWPRIRLEEQNEEYVVCQAKFQFSDQEKSELAKIAKRETFPDIVEVSRNYAEQLKVDFKDEIPQGELGIPNFEKVFDILPKVQEDFGEPFKDRANMCFEVVKDLVSEGRFTELEGLVPSHEQLLIDALSLTDPPHQMELAFISQYLPGLTDLYHNREQFSSPQSKIHEYIINHLPTFIYMSDYSIYSGSARLDEVQSRRDSGSLAEENRTFLALLDLSDLDLDTLVQLGNEGTEARERRQYRLAGGSEFLTRIISDRLRQRRYEVDYRVDGQDFFTYVKDDYDSSLIKLQERSRGFQWFFSFDLTLMHGTKGAFEGSVILLDEPGLHLHPGAQKDLLRRFEEYAENNILLYTTHLPFMIDLNHPDRIRVLKETENGIVVTTSLTERDPEARLVLQAALGIDLAQKVLIERRNLVVEGTGDYWVLTELSNLLQRSKTEGLPEDVLITAGGSASEAVPLAAFMIGQKLDVVVLFDSDDAGRQARDKLVKNWLTRYKKAHTQVVMLGDAVGVEHDFELEDLFPEDFMKEVVKETYSKELADVDVEEMILGGEDPLWDRIVRYLKQKGIKKPNKGSVEKRLRDRLSKMKDVSELSPETKEIFIKLFQTIRKAFGEGKSKSS